MPLDYNVYETYKKLLLTNTLSLYYVNPMIHRMHVKMKQIWTPENKFQKWLDVELAAVAPMLYSVILPKINMTILNKASDVKRILEIESEIHHDVIAFLTCVAEYVDQTLAYTSD